MTSASSLYLFSFERAHSDPLAFIPLGVRFFLDRCGLRLSLAQWQGLPEADRAQLASVEPALDDASAAAFAALIDRCFSTSASASSSDPVERQDPEGADLLAPAAVPETVVSQAAQHGIAGPTQTAWAGLSTGQRYALAKLARKARRSDDFALAMREFCIAG